MKWSGNCWVIACLGVLVEASTARGAERTVADFKPFMEKHCVECHDADTKKGGLDLSALKFDLATPTNFNTWVGVYDRVNNGEMPPKKKVRPEAAEQTGFTTWLASSLTSAEQSRMAQEGRSTQRRLNRYEYENALRDLLHAPWLQVRDSLPEDGEAQRFNKSGDALDISHVQMARYLAAADYALRQTMAPQVERPETQTTRYYARDTRSFVGAMKFTKFNASPERATFPVLGSHGQPDVRAGKAPPRSGPDKPEQHEQEAVGIVASAYEPIEPKFSNFKAPLAGHYKLRMNAYSLWVGPGVSNKWFIPDFNVVSRGRRPEPITVYSETPPRLLRLLGKFDALPDPGVNEIDAWLLAGETIRPDASRLFRSRPGANRYQNPLAQKDGQPGVAFGWLEVEGPLYDEWPTAGHQLLFGNLPLKKSSKPDGGVEVVSKDPHKDAERLMGNFLDHAYRRPVGSQEVKRFIPVVESALKLGNNFADAMIAGYTAVLCSPEFLCLEEKPGRLSDPALASRLAFFLWNSPPDDELRAVAAQGKLHDAAVLRAQTDRMLADPKSHRFVNAFLDYWIDLRKIVATAPDSGLYPDYYLDDLLSESAEEETRAFFSELLRCDLPARNLVDSDFAMVNEKLAAHYGLPPVEGVALRRVSLPKDSPRGGLMTQASILKVTANGTTTSPVLRGAWIMERLLGQRPPPPPPSVPAVEPDIRGAATIRQQLDKHRTQATCAACHAKIDPAGFALENFDVMGGWRDRYRAEGDGPPEIGIGKNGQRFAFHLALPVDSSGELPDGRKFRDIREFKHLLLENERQIARNLEKQLAVFATGTPVRFSDRPQLEKALDRASASQYGVKSLVEELVQSDLFLEK
jgi:cytochrome c553